MSVMLHEKVDNDYILNTVPQLYDIEAQVDLLSDLDLPSEDGIPMESNWHRIEMNLLIDSVHSLWRDREDYFAGGNMFIYYSLEQVRRKEYRGPDFFVVKGVDGTHDRDSWVVWQEDGHYPDVIVELGSPSTLKTDLDTKKDLYEKIFRTGEYFCYDPAEKRLYGWQLADSSYVTIEPNERGWMWSQQLNVWLGLWEGEFQRNTATWLRFYTTDFQLVLTFAETEARRAEAAEAENARLRALLAQHGIQE